MFLTHHKRKQSPKITRLGWWVGTVIGSLVLLVHGDCHAKNWEQREALSMHVYSSRFFWLGKGMIKQKQTKKHTSVSLADKHAHTPGKV